MHIKIIHQTTHTVCKCTTSVHICTEIVHSYNMCVVSDGLFFNMHLIYLLYLMECLKYAFTILVVSMEYIRESRRSPGRLKGGLGRGAPLRKTKMKFCFTLLRWCKPWAHGARGSGGRWGGLYGSCHGKDPPLHQKPCHSNPLHPDLFLSILYLFHTCVNPCIYMHVVKESRVRRSRVQ